MNDAVRALQAIFAAGFLPCALELADEFTLAAAAKRTKSKRLRGCKAHLIVELDGQEKSVRGEIDAVEKIIRRQKPLFRRTRLRQRTNAKQSGKSAANFPIALRDTGLTKLNEDIVVPRGRLEDLFKFAATACRRNTACHSPVSATPATATSTSTSWWTTTQPGADKRAEAASGRIVPPGACVERRDHRRTRHRPGQKTLVAAGRFQRSAGIASHGENGARPERHFESGQICFNPPMDFLRGGPDGFRQFAGFQNFCIAAPAQNPALDFGEAGKFQLQFHAAIFQFAQLLRLVPFFFADIIGGARD